MPEPPEIKVAFPTSEISGSFFGGGHWQAEQSSRRKVKVGRASGKVHPPYSLWPSVPTMQSSLWLADTKGLHLWNRGIYPKTTGVNRNPPIPLSH